MTDPLSGAIRFSSYCRPPLEPGEFKLEVKQAVEELQGGGGAPVPISPLSFEFMVGGPRFALNPVDIYSVYPPDGSTGDFAHTLPHIVFTRRTIPWERPAGAGLPSQPWMALLLFSADAEGAKLDLAKIEPRRVRDLIANLPDGVAGPKNLACASYELDDPCNTIDIDFKLFRKVAPAALDLQYLAHVREVDTDHKETASFLTEGSFSVIIGNRFPSDANDQGQVENRAVLVSLEGIMDFLPGAEVKEPPASIRLAVLASWAFQCEAARDFEQSMRDLNETLIPLRLDLPPDDGTQAVQHLRAAFSRGYAALNHTTRLGEKTVSWYRSPLSPLMTEGAARYDFKPTPDALVRYDDTNGMMDLTYAGAFQLGRLLALQDSGFTQALCGWRSQVQRRVRARLEKEELLRVLRSHPADERLLKSSDTRFLESALHAALAGEQQSAPAQVQDDGQAWTAEAVHDLPKTVVDWLARRVLLYGVPFLYLLPDERMLPMPSLRFFRVDPLWIRRLIEGACSVGRNSTVAEVADSLLGDEFFKVAVLGSAEVRRRALPQGAEAVKADDPRPPPTFPLEGFLLRSPIVRDWQGLELEAKFWKASEAGPVPAPPLRIDRLAPDIVVCIFQGPLASIEIRQPPEGMHFGASGFRKALVRKITAKDSVLAGEPGEQIELGGNASKKQIPAVEVPFRGDMDLHVIDVSELAKRLHAALTLSGAMAADAPWASFTSAEFGAQMTESPGRVEIQVRSRP